MRVYTYTFFFSPLSIVEKNSLLSLCLSKSSYSLRRKWFQEKFKKSVLFQGPWVITQHTKKKKKERLRLIAISFSSTWLFTRFSIKKISLLPPLSLCRYTNFIIFCSFSINIYTLFFFLYFFFFLSFHLSASSYQKRVWKKKREMYIFFIFLYLKWNSLQSWVFLSPNVFFKQFLNFPNWNFWY